MKTLNHSPTLAHTQLRCLLTTADHLAVGAGLQLWGHPPAVLHSLVLH